MQPLFLVFLIKCFLKCPWPKSTPFPAALKHLWPCTCTQGYSFCKMLNLKCLAVFWMSVLITAQKFVQWPCTMLWPMTLTMPCTASDTFRILAYSALCSSGICLHIQSFSALLRHIHTYWDIISYSGKFTILSNACIFTTLSGFEPWYIKKWKLI